MSGGKPREWYGSARRPRSLPSYHTASKIHSWNPNSAKKKIERALAKQRQAEIDALSWPNPVMTAAEKRAHQLELKANIRLACQRYKYSKEHEPMT